MRRAIRTKIAKVLLISIVFTQNGILQALGAGISSKLWREKLAEENEIIKLELYDSEGIGMIGTPSDAYVSESDGLWDSGDIQDSFNSMQEESEYYGEIATSSNADVLEDDIWEDELEIQGDHKMEVLEDLATASNAYRLSNDGEIWDGVSVQEVIPQNDVYYIETPAELAWVMKVTNDGIEDFAGKTIFILNDLDLGGCEWDGIGNSSHPFKGNIEGNGCTIRDIKQEKQVSYLGFIRVITVDNNLFIKNLNIENAEFSGNATYSGILAGHINLKSGTTINISKVNVDGILNASGCLFGGGLVGRIYSKSNAKINIEDVKVSGNLSVSYYMLNNSITNLGGLVGYCDNPYGAINISGCDSAIDKNATAEGRTGAYVGGIFGGCNGNGIELNRVAVTGTLLGKAPDTCVGGGLIGGCEADSIKIKNSYMASFMDMNGMNGWIGGLIGYLKCKITYKDSLFENCHVSGQLGAWQCAAFIVQNDSTTESVQVEQCYYNKSNGGLNTDDKKITNLGFLTITKIDCPHGYGIIGSEMAEEDSFIGWDFDNVWEMGENGYPELREDSRFREKLELLDVNPLKGDELPYSQVEGFSNNPNPCSIEFFLKGKYEKSEDLIFVLRKFETDEIVAYAEDEPLVEFIEENSETRCQVIFAPLPDDLKIYPAIEKGGLINDDTGEEFSILCSKVDWWFSSPEIIKDVWGFKNYGDNIELDVFRMIFSETKAKKLYKKNLGEKGLCAGMVGTVIDFGNSYISHIDFTQDTMIERISDIKPCARSEKISMSADRYIKLSFVLQIMDTIALQKKRNRNKLKELYEAVTEKESVFISLKTPDGYHALWGYGIENGDDYSDILAYDCNLGAVVRKIRLYGQYPHFSKWEYCGVKGCKNLSFVTEYPSAYLLNMLSDSVNREVGFKDNRHELLETNLSNFRVIDSFGNAVSNEEIYIDEQDTIIPIIIDSLTEDGNSDTDMYWIEPDSRFETVNSDGELKMVSLASNNQIVTIDVCDKDSLSISTDAENEIMDIELGHNSESSFTTVYEFIVNNKIATIEITGNTCDTANIKGKNDGMDINGLDISNIEAFYNGEIAKEDLQIPSDKKVNISIEQIEENVYLTVSCDDDSDGIYETDLLPPILFGETMSVPNVIPVGVIEISATESKLMIGDIIQLIATIQPENATDKRVIWSSSDDSIATISSDGILIAKKSGVVTITAKLVSGVLEKTIDIEISDRPNETKPEENKTSGLTEKSKNGSMSGNERSTKYLGYDVDQKKGYIDPLRGIITGAGPGFTRWQQDEKGWRLLYANGIYATGINVIDEKNEIHEQVLWELVNDAWFAFGCDGYLKSGFIFDYSLSEWFYIDVNKGMLTGWQYINYNWYYFNPVSDGKRGRMFVETWVDNYYVNQFGAWEKDKEKI